VVKAPEDALFVNDPRLSQNEIIKNSGVAFAPHDCRRSFISIAGGLLPGYVVKRLINHADSGDVTTAHYMRIDDATPRKAGKLLPFQRRSASSARRPPAGRPLCFEAPFAACRIAQRDAMGCLLALYVTAAQPELPWRADER
jgi:hypothetical protein